HVRCWNEILVGVAFKKGLPGLCINNEQPPLALAGRLASQQRIGALREFTGCRIHWRLLAFGGRWILWLRLRQRTPLAECNGRNPQHQERRTTPGSSKSH